MEKLKMKKESLTKEEREAIAKELGFEMAAPDDPIYKQGITINFLKRVKNPNNSKE